MKQHHKVLYYNLLTSGKLYSHLADTEEQAQALFSRLVKEYAEKESVNEQLKSTDQMAWVQKMNNIRSRVIEVVNAEVVCMRKRKYYLHLTNNEYHFILHAYSITATS